MSAPLLTNHTHAANGAGHTGPSRARSIPQRAVARPSRLNNAGYCIYCFGTWCEDLDCIEHHERSTWVICHNCEGTGFDLAIDKLCDCNGGVIDVTHSTVADHPRSKPPRRTFAGYCIYCDQRGCTSSRCIDLHDRSHWDVCDRCDGRTYIEDKGTCFCAWGLIEGTRPPNR